MTDKQYTRTQEWIRQQSEQSDSFEKQVGGEHYQTPIQPIAFIMANDLNFLEGNAVKYIVRHRDKGGRQDIEKAIHYLEMLLDYEYSEED